MALNKKALVVFGVLGVGTLILLASAGTANAAPVKKKDEDDDGDDITVQPPGPSGLPDGTVPPVKVSTDEKGNVTSVTVDAEHDDDDVLPLPVKDGGDVKSTSPYPLIEQPGSTPSAPINTAPGKAPPSGPVEAPVSPAPSITNVPPTPIAAQEVQPEYDPNGTVMLARLLLARETAPGWKEDLQPEVAEWQRIVGLKADGKFGPKSAARLAEEVGVMPLVRFYSKPAYDRPSAVKLYKETMAPVFPYLEKLKPMSEYHIEMLKISMAREKGQGIDKAPTAQATLQEVAAMNKELDKFAKRDARKALS